MSTSVHSSPEVRAVIFDLYGTLLKVLPASAAAARWRAGCPEMSLGEFDARCRAAIAQEHARMRREKREPFPEVDWLEIVQRAAPATRDAAALSRLHAACSRSCDAMPGALELVAQLRARGVLCGIASNAQSYTRDEFTGAGFQFADFAPALVFLSGEHGFAKPSPRVFAHLTAALTARGIAPARTLMAGDRPDNDLAPAAAAGWQTWLYTEQPGDGITGGDWPQFAARAGRPDLRRGGEAGTVPP